jgi:DNA invertase Pin-like site-specific DNA recombinase
MPLRAAIYTRISRDDQGDSAGVARQEEDCRDLCRRRGWQVAEVFIDNDISAYSGRRRPGYERLKESMSGGMVDAVVAWAPERLQRSPRELEDFIDLVEARGIKVETVKAGTWDVSTSHGRLTARMLGAVSRNESERIGERVTRAHEQIRKEGRWLGACPYGMRRTAASGVLEVDVQQAATVRFISDRIIKGDALTKIAAELNSSGSLPRRGTAWTHTGILRLISSPALGGLHEVDGECRPAAFSGPLTEDEWRMVQFALRSRPRGETRRPRETLTLLGGIMQCQEHKQNVFGGGTDYSRTYSAAAPGICHVTIGREPVDEFIRTVIVTRLLREDAVELLVAPESDGPSEVEAEALRLRRSEITDLVADGLIPISEARVQLQRIAERLNEYEFNVRSGPLNATVLADPQVAWDGWTMPQRRAAITALFESISVTHLAKAQGPTVNLSRIKFKWRNAGT